MTLDVVNVQNEKVGDLEVDEATFGGRVRTGLIWEAVVHQNAAERSGTHSTKTRGLVRGSGVVAIVSGHLCFLIFSTPPQTAKCQLHSSCSGTWSDSLRSHLVC